MASVRRGRDGWHLRSEAPARGGLVVAWIVNVAAIHARVWAGAEHGQLCSERRGARCSALCKAEKKGGPRRQMTSGDHSSAASVRRRAVGLLS